MLHWLRKTIPKRVYFWAKLSGGVAGVHLGCLLALFFWYQGDRASLTLELTRQMLAVNEAEVVVMPLYKKVARPKKVCRPVVTPRNKKCVTKKPATKLASKPVSKKTKSVQRSSAKRAVSQPKPASKKEECKQERDIKKDKQEQTVPKKKDVVHQNAPDKKPKQASAQQEQEVQTNEPTVVGRDEYEALRMQTYLQHEILEHWSPPAGIASDRYCSAQFIVDRAGKAREIVVVHTSGVLAYDVSVRAALQAATFPAWAQGRTCTVTFKQ